MNVSPGGLFGGGATQYFVGEFDGNTFHCDTPAHVSKWLDYGKDHYAAVTFANTGDRAITMAWMSNWRYGALVPTRQFRGAMALPRELKLFSTKDGIFASAAPVAEVAALWKDAQSVGSFNLGAGEEKIVDVRTCPAFHLSFNMSFDDNSETLLQLSNSAGEKVCIKFDKDKVSIDRSESGLMTDHRHFADVVVAAPLSLCDGKDGYDVDVYVDVASIELFVDGGRVAMTDIVFPTEPYSQLSVENIQGESMVKDMSLQILR